MKLELREGECFGMLRELEAESLDGLITDPPYASGGLHSASRMRTTRAKYSDAAVPHPDFTGDARDQRGYLAWGMVWLGECHRVLSEGAPVCLFSDWRQLPLMTDLLQAAGFVWRGVLVWDKGLSARPQPGRPRQQGEFIVWGSKGPYDGRGRPPLPGVISAPPVPPRRRRHLTEKPVEVVEPLVQLVREGGRVLDPFAGSAPVAEACRRQGRDYLGMELSPAYLAVARERLGLP